MGAKEPDLSNVVAFPTTQPAGEVVARLQPGDCLDDVTTWSIETLNVGPPRSSSRYDAHLDDTVGSSYDWSDELRFDKHTGRLVSLVLRTPEAGTIDTSVARSWLALPRQPGLPILVNREQGFHVDALDLRYFSDDGSALIAADASLPLADSSSLRLAIGQDTDLLFYRGRYSAWILRNPIAHLISSPGDAPVGADEPRLHAFLHEYLTLVVEPNITRMNDEDPVLKTAMLHLHERLGQLQVAQARVLERAIRRILETFYLS
jgi:hypothetical protein